MQVVLLSWLLLLLLLLFHGRCLLQDYSNKISGSNSKYLKHLWQKPHAYSSTPKQKIFMQYKTNMHILNKFMLSYDAHNFRP
jgi:hypothetical protein